MPLIQLTGLETINLRDALWAAFPAEADFVAVVVLADQKLDGVSAAGQPMPMRILQTIKHAEANNWLPKLLTAACVQNPADASLQRFREELQAKAPPPHISPFQMCRLGGGTVMVNRKTLREGLEELKELQGRRVMVIRGDSWSGKSHSLQLILFIEQYVGGFNVVPLDLDPRRDDKTRLVISAQDLASRLVRVTGYSITVPDSPVDFQWSKWVTNFCDSFVSAVGSDNRERWIIIDGMNKVLLDQSAVDLVQDLVHRVHNALPRLRLVLVGYDQSLPPLVLPYVLDEKVARITIEDLVEFFVLAHQEMNRLHDEEALAQTVSQIVNNVDMTSVDYLVKLGPLVAQEVRKIKKRAP